MSPPVLQAREAVAAPQGWAGAGEVLAQAPVGLAVLDLAGAVAEANAAFLELAGGEREAVVGRPFSTFVPRHARDEVDRRLARLMLGTARMVQLGPVALADGAGQREALLAAARLERGGELCGLIVSAQPAARPLAVDAALAQAQKLQAVGQLAGGVAHDFNNLLTVIMGFADLLLARHGEADPSYADIVQIRGTANRGVALVRQLLAFSRQQATDPVVLDPVAAIANLSLLLTRLLRSAIELRLEGDDRPLRVLIDPVRFDQVILNLAVNARDAMPSGGRLTIATAPQTVGPGTMIAGEAVPPGEYVRVTVADTGVGIPDDVLGHIFEPFFTTKAPGAGTGLGLATVYGIVRQAGGFVAVDSAPGRGAEFALLLPSAVAQPPAEGEPAPVAGPCAHDAPAAEQALPATILLVEDEAGVRALSAEALRRAGYRVLAAEDGEAALALLDAEARRIDALITDVMLPGVDGPALARIVADRLGPIPVILTSGCAEEASAAAVSIPDATALAKPFTLPQLTATLAAALGASPTKG
ncbi:MAG: ATP-binding protein [Rhodospirillales bacterium]|nr:ATP-binding protein [Rhodospirillales bacterium]